MADLDYSDYSTDPPLNYGYFVVLFAFVIIVVLWGVFHSFGIYFKSMISEFGWTRASTSGAFSLASFLSGLVAAYTGFLNDRFGPRMVMSLCGLFLGFGCMFMSRAESLWHFYLFFGVIIGFAMGGGFIPLMSTVTRWFTVNRGLMTGIVASGVGVGTLIIPQISNALLLRFGWRTSYFITGIGVLVVVVPAAQFLKNQSGRGDGAREISKQEDSIGRSASMGEALGSVQFWLFSLTGFCYGYNLFSLTVHVVPHAVDLGVIPGLAAGLLSTYGGLSIVGKILFGRVLDKIHSKKTMFIGFTMMTAAFLGLVFSERIWALFTSVGVFGFFYGACTVSHSPMTATLFGLKSHGLIMGVLAISVTIGGALGPFLTGAVFDQTGSYRIAFAICAVVSLIGMAGTAGLKHTRIQLQQPSKRWQFR